MTSPDSTELIMEDFVQDVGNPECEKELANPEWKPPKTEAVGLCWASPDPEILLGMSPSLDELICNPCWEHDWICGVLGVAGSRAGLGVPSGETPGGCPPPPAPIALSSSFQGW